MWRCGSGSGECDAAAPACCLWQGRSTASIDKLLPAGTVDLDKMPERGAFDVGAAGDAAWAAAVDGATQGFALCSRQASTAREHVSYMIEWQRWLTDQGFGIYVEQARAIIMCRREHSG